MILFLIVLIALSTLPAHAQPQAPIEWGPMRLLMQMPASQEFCAQDVYPCGDTLVLHGGRSDSVTSQYYPTLAVSGDNGNTWSPWAILGEPGELHHSEMAQVVFLSSGIYCCAQTRRSRGGFYRSTDLGQSWQPPPRHSTVCGSRPSAGTLWFVSPGWTVLPGQQTVD